MSLPRFDCATFRSRHARPPGGLQVLNMDAPPTPAQTNDTRASWSDGKGAGWVPRAGFPSTGPLGSLCSSQIGLKNGEDHPPRVKYTNQLKLNQI